MTHEAHQHLHSKLVAAAVADDHDPELYLDAAEAIAQLLDQNEQHSAELAALRAENARLQLMERIDY